MYPNIGLVIDLTPAKRYYDPVRVLKPLGINYAKLPCQGGGSLPSYSDRQNFFNVVDDFRQHSDKLIGVHCFHGLNRTGFMICLYMIHKLNFSSKNALEAFRKARGHDIVRQGYIDHLYSTSKSRRKSNPNSSSNYQNSVNTLPRKTNNPNSSNQSFVNTLARKTNNRNLSSRHRNRLNVPYPFSNGTSSEIRGSSSNHNRVYCNQPSSSGWAIIRPDSRSRSQNLYPNANARDGPRRNRYV